MQTLHARPFVAGVSLQRRRSRAPISGRQGTLRVQAAARRSLSIAERIKYVRGAIEERQRAVANRFGKTKLAALFGVVVDTLSPAVRAIDLVRRRTLQDYYEFLERDQMEMWAWECRHYPESLFWAEQPPNLLFFLGVLMYQALLPVSFLFCGVLPLYLAWILWEPWWRSPLGLALLITWPMKFPPWVFFTGPFAWIWPGLL